jgi:hypothetical protein
VSDAEDDEVALASYTRLRRVSDKQILEVADVTWKGASDVDIGWLAVTAFELAAGGQAEAARRDLLSQSTYFFRCEECKRRCHASQEWERHVCQSCASGILGVLF